MKYTDSALQRLTKAELIETVKLLKKNCEELEEVNDRQYKMLAEKEHSVCDDCELGSYWGCHFCCAKCYECYGECPDEDCDSMDI